MTALDSPASFTTLPRAFYLDDAALVESEMARIWDREWLYLAHASEIAEPVSTGPLGRSEPAWGHARTFGSWCAGSVIYCYAD